MSVPRERRLIPLFDLSGRSPSNVRKARAGDDLASLAASIESNGILQQLIVSPDPDMPGKFWISEGGRRFEALQSLRAARKIDVNYPVPCDVYPDEPMALAEASLAANIVRRDLHPVEECEAFETLARAGLTEERIARNFAVPVRHVRQRRALTKLSAAVRAAWRDNRFGAEVAQAFTASPDHVEQDALLAALGQTRAFDPATIKNRLRRDALPATSRVARYVGPVVYVAAGGRIDDNLFEDHALWLDGALARRLARESMMAEGARLIEHFSLGAVMLRAEIPDYADWTELPRELAPKEASAIQAGVPLAREIEILIKAIGRATKDRSWRARATLVLDLDDQGDLVAEVGMVPPPPADRGAEPGPGAAKPRKAAKTPDQDPDPPMPPEETTPPPSPIAATIIAARTAGVVAALTSDPILAVCLATAALQARFNASPIRIATTARNTVKSAKSLPTVGFAKAFFDLRYAIGEHPDQDEDGNTASDLALSLFADRVAEAVVFDTPRLDKDGRAVMDFILANAADIYAMRARAAFDYEAYCAALPRQKCEALAASFDAHGLDVAGLPLKALRPALATLARDRRWLPAELLPAEPSAASPSEPDDEEAVKDPSGDVPLLAAAMASALEADGAADADASDTDASEGDASDDADEAPAAPANGLPSGLELAVEAFLAARDMARPGDEHARIKASVLYEHFCASASRRNPPPTMSAFSAAITALGYKKHRHKTGVYYLGIAAPAKLNP
jgi:ParB family chromosome partitioning protein